MNKDNLNHHLISRLTRIGAARMRIGPAVCLVLEVDGVGRETDYTDVGVMTVTENSSRRNQGMHGGWRKH